MSSRARVSFLKHQVSEVYKSSGSAWTGYLFALALEGILFVVSRGLKSESEILFALIYVISAILIAIFLGQGPGIFAGILAVICVDYHYIGPLGKGLNTIEGFVFLILTLGVVQLALVGVWLLQNTARDTEEARAKLEEAVRSREEILAVVAHDLRQPLAAFTLRQDLALRNLKTGQIENVMRLLQDGQRSLHQMDQLIEDLLDGSRVDAGNVSLSLEKIDLEELARNSYDAFYLQAVNKQILFRFIASFEKLPDLLIDSHRVKMPLDG